MNGRRVRELVAACAAWGTEQRTKELHRVLGELVHAAAAEWRESAARKIEDLEHEIDVSHSDLYLVFRGQKRLDGRLLLMPPAMLRVLLRELGVYAALQSGEIVDADVRNGNAKLVIALADLQAHDSRASADHELSPDECRRGLELVREARAELDRRERLYERGLGERGVRESKGAS